MLYFALFITKNLYQLKKIVPAVILLIAAACSTTDNVKPNKKYQNNWKSYNLKDSVKSITEFNFKQYVPLGELVYPVSKENFRFDKTGNVLDRSTFMENERFCCRYTYQYDKAGNYTEVKSYESDSTLSDKETYKYDGQGNMIETVRYDRDNRVKSKDQYSYDEHGNFIEFVHAGTFSSKFMYTYNYDTLSRLVSETCTLVEGSIKTVKSTTDYIYKGDSVEEVSGGSDKTHVLLVYNPNHQMILRKNLNPANQYFEQTWKFDSLGNETETKNIKDAVIEDKRSYRHAYVYDNKGNWIKRTTTRLDGKLISSVERKIEYY